MPETTPAGATPAAADATSAQTTPVSPAVTPAAPATDDAAALGEPGKRALDAMKAERDAAKRAAADVARELDELRNASRTDAEKALAAAKKEGASEVLARVNAQIRRSEVKAALVAAGINDTVLDLAVRAEDFASLQVSDEGTVDGLDDAVAKFKKAKADLFGPRRVPGADLGAGSGSPSGLTEAAIRAMTPAQYAARRSEIFQFMENKAK